MLFLAFKSHTTVSCSSFLSFRLSFYLSYFLSFSLSFFFMIPFFLFFILLSSFHSFMSFSFNLIFSYKFFFFYLFRLLFSPLFVLSAFLSLLSKKFCLPSFDIFFNSKSPHLWGNSSNPLEILLSTQMSMDQASAKFYFSIQL